MIPAKTAHANLIPRIHPSRETTLQHLLPKPAYCVLLATALAVAAPLGDAPQKPLSLFYTAGAP